MAFTVVLDACVLYSAPLRDLLLSVAETGLYRPRWTEAINDEWTKSLKAKFPEKSDKIDRTRLLVDRSVPDCLITGYESLMPSLSLPDENDRHVFAAAICGRADVIVTTNVRDFPDLSLANFGIKAWHPDRCLMHLLSLDDAKVLHAVKTIRGRLRHPVVSPADYLDNLQRIGLSNSASYLRQLISHI